MKKLASVLLTTTILGLAVPALAQVPSSPDTAAESKIESNKSAHHGKHHGKTKKKSAAGHKKHKSASKKKHKQPSKKASGTAPKTEQTDTVVPEPTSPNE